MKREAKFTVLFRHYLKANPMYHSCAFELKQTGVDFLPFDAVKAHQLDALDAASEGHFLYKIPDDSRGVKPFDMVYLKNAQAFIVIKYPGFFCFIDPVLFVAEKKTSMRKSLTSARAKEIAYVIVDL